MESNKASQKRRDVVLVGTKLRPSSRELLTWTLAKFTKPGDEVVALHIVPKQQPSSLSPAAFTPSVVTQGEVEAIFDSVIGVYDGFCSAKQIKLQLKVINGGSSMRRALVEEVQHYNAIRLILGASMRQHQSKENSSLSLAKYCATNLPITCSVLIIQHGEVVFEKAGVLTSGDTKQGVQIMRDKKAGPLVSNNARGKCKVQNLDESGKNQSIRCLSRVRDVSGHMVHPYKYVPPPHVQGLHTCILELEKLSTMAAATSTSRAKCHVPSIVSKSRSHPSNDCSLKKCCFDNEDRSGQEKLISSDLKQCRQKHSSMSAHNRGWPLVKTGWNSSEPFPSNISLGLEKSDHAFNDRKQPSKEGNCKTQKFRRRRRHTASDIPQGWPLLHWSLAATKLENPQSKARKMSVVEWVLQLPERPKGSLKSSSEMVLQEMPNCSATENVQKSMGMSNNQEAMQGVLEMGIEPEAEKTLLEKCYLLCKSRKCVVFVITDLEKSTNNFSKDNMIGKGGCSRVYRGVLSDDRVVAIKCFDNTSAALASENEFLTELEIVSGLHHRHIIELLGYCVDNQQHPLLVYSFATEGNLEQKLHQADDKAGLPWSVRYKVALGIGEAIEYLHNSPHPVIHRDVKSSNILLQSDLTPQLTDFGLSKWASTTSSFLTCNDVVGTFGYLAPEYFMFGKVSDKTDVYSFGVVLLELVSGKHPIEKVGCNGQQVNLILWARPLLEEESSHIRLVDSRLEKGYSVEQLKNMLMAASLCLQHSPHARPSMSKILKVLKGENVDLELRQDSMSIDGCVVPSYGDDYGIHDHLTLALYGLDDDLTSQAGSDQKACRDNTNKLLEEYLGGRYSRSSSFD